MCLDHAVDYERPLTHTTSLQLAPCRYELSFVMVNNVWGESRTYATQGLPPWIKLDVTVTGAREDPTPPMLLLIDLPEIVYGPSVVAMP